MLNTRISLSSGCGRKLAIIIALSGCVMTGLAHAESAYTNRNTDLYEQAMLDAAKLASLMNQTKLELLQRNGAWAQVKTGQGQLGWVQMFHLRVEAASLTQNTGRSASPNVVGNLLAGGRTTTSGSVGTGVKGLSKEDIQNAQVNFSEFQKMQSFAANKQTANEYARLTKLNARNITETESNR